MRVVLKKTIAEQLFKLIAYIEEKNLKSQVDYLELTHSEMQELVTDDFAMRFNGEPAVIRDSTKGRNVRKFCGYEIKSEEETSVRCY